MSSRPLLGQLAGMASTHARWLHGQISNPPVFNGLLKLDIRGAAKRGDCQHLAPWTRGDTDRPQPHDNAYISAQAFLPTRLNNVSSAFPLVPATSRLRWQVEEQCVCKHSDVQQQFNTSLSLSLPEREVRGRPAVFMQFMRTPGVWDWKRRKNKSVKMNGACFVCESGLCGPYRIAFCFLLAPLQ